jgi:glycosyltransferase involved in cell wall biosynthesis
MKKLLYIAPHLSTGGLPQYLTKKIELLKDKFEIYLVEWVDCTGGVLVVTRNKIVKLIDSDKFFTLGDNKQELINIISKIKPDIIHLEEIPEFFMDSDITKQIYNPNRKYVIVETSHDSSYDVSNKQFFPDKFMFVSQWQIDQYKSIDVPSVLIEYPIEYIERPDRTEVLRNLHLDPTKKHILHVGLYTSRKNQKEFFEYAKAFPEYEFHSLGNRADNFKWYWEPLEQNTPPNLTWWNERTDVDAFYQAMDLFLFTSRGTNNDKETMPLVIREAISNQIPTLIYNLEVYQNYFDKFEKVNYLDFDSFRTNCDIIKNTLEQNNNINLDEEAIVISTYPISSSTIQTTKECIESLRQTGRKIILTSHIPIPEELQKIVDYCLYDSNNILTKHTFYKHTWVDYDTWRVDLNLTGEDNDVYHGPAVYTNYYNAAVLANNLGIKKLYFLNYDYYLKNSLYIDNISLILNNKKAYVCLKKEQEGNTVTTFFLASDPQFYLNHFPLIKTSKDYDDLMVKWGSESNGLENLAYHTFNQDKDKIYWEEESKFNNLITENFEHKDYSRIEYFSVIPIKDNLNQFAVFLHVNNFQDSRVINITITENDNLISDDNINFTNKMSWFKQIFSNIENIYEIKYKSFDEINGSLIETKVIKIDKDYFENKINQNGLLILK